MTPRPNNSRDERGVAMLYVAFFMFSSFWLVSLALDMGKLMVTKTELQKAADAAALAAASAIDEDTGNLVQDVARARAYETASRNTALEDKATPVLIDMNADVSFPKPNRVKVSVHRTAGTGNAMTTIFARTLGITHLDVSADATAEVGPVSPCHFTVPFAPIEPKDKFKLGCGNEYTLTWMPQKSKDKNAATVSFARKDDPDGDKDKDKGKDEDDDEGGPGGGNGHDYSPPDVVVMNFDDNCNEGACEDFSGGQALLDCYLKNGYGCCLEEGQEFPAHTGNDLNHVDKSLISRWDADTDQKQDICFSEYTGNGYRVLVAPIVTIGWDGDDYPSDFGFTGKAKIVGFVSFFLTKKPSQGKDNVTGQFIQYIVPGEPIAENPGGNSVYGTRLIE